MTTQITTTTPPMAREDVQGAASHALPWKRFGLVGVLLIAALANGFRLTQEGYANPYYDAAVQNMLRSWRNFFFVGFDNFVSVDKPPLGFWVQAASAKLFGFSAWSVLLPQAVAGVLSVLLVYVLVRRPFGAVAGLLAALVLAVTPASIAVNRNNTIDALLVLTTLAAAWCVSRAAERGQLRWLIAGFALVGLGFNIKMLQAYLVLPALLLVYLVARSAGRWPLRLVQLGIATIVLLVVSFSWATVVELTPASARPYVGSTQNNSVYGLIFGYNGLQRLLGPTFGNRAAGGTATGATPGTVGAQTGDGNGQLSPVGQLPTGADGQLPPFGTLPTGANGGIFPPFPGGSGGGGAGYGANFGPGGTFETGNPGVLRLLNTQLAGQIGWLLPLAVIGLLAAAWQLLTRRMGDAVQSGTEEGPRRAGIRRLFARPLTARGQSLVLWGTWFVTVAAFFSVAKEFHRYYLSMLAPAVAALVGIGVVALWGAYRRGGLLGWLLPVALVCTVTVQGVILRAYPQWSTRLTPVIVGCCALAAVVLLVARARPSLTGRPVVGRSTVAAATLGMLALLIAPTVWAAIPIAEGHSFGLLPAAGPATGFGPGSGAGPRRQNQPDNLGGADPMLVSYLKAHQGDATYLVAGQSANTVAAFALAANEPVIALGGFLGSDPVFTTDRLASLVGDGSVRYFLLMQFPGGAGAIPGGFPGASSGATSWVTDHCTAVRGTAWQGSATGTANGGFNFAQLQTLYDCGANGKARG